MKIAGYQCAADLVSKVLKCSTQTVQSMKNVKQAFWITSSARVV